MSYEKKHFYTPCVRLSVYMRSSQYTYTIVGGGGGALPPTSPLPLNTYSHNIATRRPPHPSNMQLQHATATGNCARDNLRGQKSLGPLKMSLEMAHKVIVPQKKIISRSFLNSGTLIVILFVTVPCRCWIWSCRICCVFL